MEQKESLPRVATYEFTAYPFRCDVTDKLFLGNLGNMMLNAADFHSNARGFGMNYLNPRHLTWVLSRFVIEMKSVPRAYDHFTVSTWVENAMRFFTSRNYSVEDAEGHNLGYGRSIWAMINTETRQPVDLTKVRDGEIMDWVEAEKPCPIDKCSRVKVDKDAEEVGSVVAQYSDVDVNGHVNSVRYLDHVLDLWPLEWHREHALKRLEAVYVAEAHAGDTLRLLREDMGNGEYHVAIMKQDVECCRVSVSFSL